LKELQQKVDDAGKRHEEYLRDQKERVAKDNEQRKRRVNQNIQAKEQELEKKREEQLLREEKIRQFGDDQRLPKTPAKGLTPGKFQTPGQKIIPVKRLKATHAVTLKTESKPVVNKPKVVSKPPFIVTPVYFPKPRPAIIPKVNKPKSIETITEKTAEVTEQSTTIEKTAEVTEKSTTTTTEEVQKAPAISAAKKTVLLNENVYEMTPEKVFQPSTENDYNVIDLSSGDETDSEDNPRKKVPQWADNDTLRKNMQNLFRHVSKDTISAHFGTIEPPKMAVLFANNGKDYESLHNETTNWESPIAKPNALKGNPRDAKK